METDVNKNSTCGILKYKNGMIVTYWPSTEPSIKRCTCAKKRKLVDIKQKYNQNTVDLSQLETRWRSESQRQTEGFGHSVTHGWATAAKMGKTCFYGQKNLGSICSSLSPSPTHFSHTTSINPFENKVWGIHFYKEVCSFVHWSSSLLLIMFPLIFVLCICMSLYNI